MKRYVKAVIFLAVMLVILILSHHYGWTDIFMNTIPELKALVNKNPVEAMIIYVIATSAGCVLLAMPGAVFAVIAGLIFEPFTGTLLCISAATLGAVLSFLAGRYFLRDSIRPVLMRNTMLNRLLFEESESEHNIMLLLAITRMIPLFPYNLQNFAYGITDIKLLPYTVYTFLFMAPGAAIFTLGAAGTGDAERRKLYFFLALVLALIVSAVGIILRKKFIRR